ncbi:hypothetical protein Zmor_025599 [Zophobas morio]|uniref:Alanine--glyoxylate aminotransferase n=1 Tax=Zophobas morio TaxID=2755281 RepID=A0AA38M469_9CUCU|nr:hypothetical protein Zmor_025599 [Zophobas morio]
MAENETLDYENVYKKSAKRFMHKEYLLLGGGPINCSDRVLKAISMQTLNPLSVDMHQLMDEIKEMTQYLFQTKNRLTLVSQTSGSGGNETIITNLLDRGDKLVIAIGGTWGERVLDMALRYEYDVLPLTKPAGEVYTLEELENAVKSHKAKLLFVTHGESTGGILQKLEGLGPMCHKYGCLLGVDAVVSIAVDPLFVDRWEIDAVNAGTQKAIGAPPGMCLLTFSPRAEQRMREKKMKPPYYFDMLRQGIYFDCFGDHTRMFHYTFSSNMLSAVREALAQICEEGLLEIWARHKRNVEYFWKRLDEIGYTCFVNKRENRFHGVTGVNVPEGISQRELIKFAKDKYDIEIAPGFGPTLNKAMRLGLMGTNSRPEMADYLIEALKDGFQYLNK